MAHDPSTSAVVPTEPVGAPEQPNVVQAFGEHHAHHISTALSSALKARALRPGQDFRVAWILLLLDRGTSYGYAMTRELDAHGLNLDSPTTYRLLRKLDDAGWVSSTWTESAAGPRRRSYELTATGQRVLRDMAALVAATRTVQDQFLMAYATKAWPRATHATFPRVAAVGT